MLIIFLKNLDVYLNLIQNSKSGFSVMKMFKLRIVVLKNGYQKYKLDVI